MSDGIPSARHTNTQIDREEDRETDRQTDRQADCLFPLPGEQGGVIGRCGADCLPQGNDHVQVVVLDVVVGQRWGELWQPEHFHCLLMELQT